MVKSQAKTVALELRVRRPNNHVTPSRGSRIRVARRIVLWSVECNGFIKQVAVLF